MNDTPGSQPEGFWENLRASIAGVATGGVLFITSFVILWVNEGRVDLSQIARKSTQIPSAAVDAASEGKFVSVTGPLTVAGKLGDAPYLLPGDYVSLDRQVQMYSWVERRPTQTGKQKSVQQSPPGSLHKRSHPNPTEAPDPPLRRAP